MSDTFTLNRGSDLSFQFNWPNGIGGNANLTGYTISGFEVHPTLASNLTLNIQSPSTGLITGLINWANNMPSGRVMSFRIKLTLGETDITTNQIWIDVR